MARKIPTRSGAARRANFNEKAEAVTSSQEPVAEQQSAQEPAIEQKQETTVKQPPKKEGLQRKSFKAIVTGRVSNIERSGTHLQLPVALKDMIDEDISGTQISVYTALLQKGYEAVMQEAEASGGMTHIEISELLEEYKK